MAVAKPLFAQNGLVRDGVVTRSIIDVIIELGEGVHPESLAAKLPPVLLRVPIVRSQNFRNFLRVILWSITLMALIITVPPVHLFPKYSSLAPLISIACGIPPFIGLYRDMPNVATKINSALNHSAIIMYAAPFAMLALSAVLVAVSASARSAQGVFGGISLALLSVYLLHFFNQFSPGKTWSGRAARQTLACASYTALCFLLSTFSISSVFYAGIVAQRSLRTNDAGLIWTKIGLIITGSVLVLGLTSRVVVRQQKYKTQLIEALNEVGLRLLHGRDVKALHRAALNLDSYLATGVDSGSSIFRTAYETKQLRTILVVLFCKLGCPALDKKDLEYHRIVDLVGFWDSGAAKKELIDFIQEQRKFLCRSIDRSSS